jgi:hypothetical protein
MPERFWEKCVRFFRQEARQNKVSASGKSVCGFSDKKRDKTKVSASGKSVCGFSDKKRDKTKSARQDKARPKTYKGPLPVNPSSAELTEVPGATLHSITIAANCYHLMNFNSAG